MRPAVQYPGVWMSAGGVHYALRRTRASAFLPTDIAGLVLWTLRHDGDFYQDGARTTAAAVNDPVGGVEDYSGQANHASQATASAKPTLTSDAPANLGTGKSPNFDGTDDYLDLGNPASLAINTNLTLAAWVNPTGAYGMYRTIIQKRNNGGGTNYEIFLELTTGRFGYYDGSAVHVSAINPTANQWSHVAATVAGTALKLYVNGSEVATPTVVTPNAANGTKVWIGAADNPAGGNEYFAGKLADVLVYNVALTAAQILQLYNGY